MILRFFGKRLEMAFEIASFLFVFSEHSASLYLPSCICMHKGERKVFLITRFSSKCFSCLWAPDKPLNAATLFTQSPERLTHLRRLNSHSLYYWHKINHLKILSYVGCIFVLKCFFSAVLFSRKNLKTRMMRDQNPLQKEEEQEMG